MSYPKDLLSSRAVVKPGLWAVLPGDGLVNNVIPYIKGCRVSIVASPKMGAGFVQYVVEAGTNGHTVSPFAAEAEVEGFLYVIRGELKVTAGEQTVTLTEGGYVYSPAGTGISFVNQSGSECKFLLYKQVYIPLEEKISAKSPEIIIGNVNEIEYRIYEEMDNVLIKDLLPTELEYDMNMHILAFKPGGCHPIVETHVQEHGAYVLSGEGMYYLDDRWMGIKEEDFLWFGPYVAQCAYGVGTELFAYIYSKDCNRDVVF
ncbi:(S)-ureidoglycine aminohydrolase [Anaerocolumna sp. MB42-C2]|uniref:(S)-ureidoglycine aminohydrolase n=1 Tax=Anaerocolumna sp. MB42-C2 TaxID=3070997 RepID=UPI0027DF0B18|nr:(S)-ureidoglycine aminohydrolase [Anaerocolumna sp. MB42-C2]WMJ86985.1 (S)-ureidoglycine aminohydrolase [Anaerocolumna sp. MB42-C2]